MPEIKICGNMSEQDVLNAQGADMLGFILGIQRSRHSLTVEKAKPLFRLASDFARTVAVIDSVSMFDHVCAELDPDFVQMHTELSAEELRLLSRKARIISLVRPDSGAPDRAASLAGCSSIVMCDSFLRGQSGGTGRTHDWNISRAVRDRIFPTPFMLSGGLNPENVADAVRTVRPAVLDVSAGVESEGRKSRELILSFMRNAGEV